MEQVWQVCIQKNKKAEGEGEGIVREFEIEIYTLLYLKWITMDNQWTYCIAQELCSTLCGSLDERGVWGGMDTCICVTESLHCSLEITTMLLISYESGRLQ